MLHCSPRRWRVLPLATILALLGFAGAAQASTDLALNAPVVASSTFSTNYPASQAVDGNTSTRWAAAANKTPDTLQVELNTSYYVNQVSVLWGTDYPTSYQLQTSGDGSASSWQTIYSTTSGNGGTDVITLPNDLTRFLRVVGLNQNDSWGNSIYNLSVYGTAPSNGGDTTAPSVPTGLNGTSGDKTAALTWSASSDNVGVTGYDVYRNGVKLATTSSTSFNDTGLTDGTAYSYTVDAYDAAGNVSAQSTAVTATPQAPVSSGAVVAATPTGPNVPSGGWSVAYADGFGGCIPGTTCNLSGAPTDNTITPKTGQPSNSNEPTWYVPAQNVIDSTGLHQHVTYQPGIASGKNYAAGALKTNANSPAPGGAQFQFDPGQGPTWAFQIVAKLPPTTGEEDPGYWADDSTWSWEIDFPEWWGWHTGSGGKDWTASNGDGMGFPAIPKCGCGSTGNVSFYWNGSQLTFAPDAAYHTYTVEMIGTTMFSWLDGKPMGTGRTYGSVGSWSKNLGNLILQHSLRDPTTGNPDPYFMSGTRSFDVKSIAVYENATANFANTAHHGIAPGTTVQ